MSALSQHDEKHVVPKPLSGIRVGKRREKRRIQMSYEFLLNIVNSIFVNVIYWTPNRTCIFKNAADIDKKYYFKTDLTCEGFARAHDKT
jgi:hypothetical protein